MSQTSSLNIAIKNGKQRSNSITVEDRRAVAPRTEPGPGAS